MELSDIESAGADDRVVIVGGGQAGAECAANLRMLDFAGPITILSEEAVHPYGRPPLSKGYLLGDITSTDLYIRPPATYEDQRVEVRLATQVTGIDRATRTVRTEGLDGVVDVPYDWLVLATGGRARLLPDAKAHAAPNVHTLRRLTDIDAMRTQFIPGARMVVLGGGYVGLEVASVARKSGLDVTVVEAAPRVLARVTVPIVSDFFERIHKQHGVDIRTCCSVDSVELGPDGRAVAVKLADGVSLPADVVVVGIGMVANDELAHSAGLAVDAGVLVDEFCRTTDPRIFAVGDCTRHPCAQNGGFRRVESVPNAMEQAEVAAGALTGAAKSHDAVPWFWSDQYDVKLQVVGLCPRHDEIIIRGSVGAGQSFSLFYLKDGAICAADVVNNPRDFMAAKKLVAMKAQVDTALLSDPATSLKELLAEASRVTA